MEGSAEVFVGKPEPSSRTGLYVSKDSAIVVGLGAVFHRGGVRRSPESPFVFFVEPSEAGLFRRPKTGDMQVISRSYPQHHPHLLKTCRRVERECRIHHVFC
jgi:hypothetical protein